MSCSEKHLKTNGCICVSYNLKPSKDSIGFPFPRFDHVFPKRFGVREKIYAAPGSRRKSAMSLLSKSTDKVLPLPSSSWTSPSMTLATGNKTGVSKNTGRPKWIHFGGYPYFWKHTKQNHTAFFRNGLMIYIIA